MAKNSARRIGAEISKLAAKKKAKKQKKSAVHIGDTVRTLRKAMGLSTTALAEKVGTSQSQISRLETNVRGFQSSTLAKIAKVLKVKPWALLMNDEERDVVSNYLDMEA